MPMIETSGAGILALTIGDRQEFGRFETVGQRDKAVPCLPVWQEHGRGVSLPYLERMDEELSFTIVQLKQNLRGLANPGNGFVCVAIAQ